MISIIGGGTGGATPVVGLALEAGFFRKDTKPTISPSVSAGSDAVCLHVFNDLAWYGHPKFKARALGFRSAVLVSWGHRRFF